MKRRKKSSRTLAELPSEYDEQCTFVDWLEHKNLKFSSIPNSTWTTSWAQKTKNHNSGLRKGLPDILVSTPRGLVFIEMKKQKAPPSAVKPHQQEWIDELNKHNGVQAQVCRGSGEAIEFIEQFI